MKINDFNKDLKKYMHTLLDNDIIYKYEIGIISMRDCLIIALDNQNNENADFLKRELTREYNHISG